MARAMLHAMQTLCAPGAHAFQSDELHCWYNDAKDVVNVAQRSVDVAEPIGFCMPSAIAAGIDTPPATPSSRRCGVSAVGGDALDTLPKRRPPVREIAFAVPLLAVDTRVKPDVAAALIAPECGVANSMTATKDGAMPSPPL